MSAARVVSGAGTGMSRRGLGEAPHRLRNPRAHIRVRESPWSSSPPAFVLLALVLACILQPCARPRGVVQLTGERPRIFLTENKCPGTGESITLDSVRDRALGPDRILDTDHPDGTREQAYGRLKQFGVEWLQQRGALVSDAAASGIGFAATALAFLHVVEASGDLSSETPFGARAMELAVALCDSLSPHSASAWAQDLRNSRTLYALAVVYDWTYDLLLEKEARGSQHRRTVICEMDSLATWLRDYDQTRMPLDFSNHCHQNAMAVGVAGLSLLDPSSEDSVLSHRAASWVQYANRKFLRDFDRVVALFPDGGWYESLGYYQTALNMVRYLEALRTATGGRIDFLGGQLGRHYRPWFALGPSFMLYGTMPDGSLLRWNDMDEIPGVTPDIRLVMAWVSSRLDNEPARFYAAWCDSARGPLPAAMLPCDILWRASEGGAGRPGVLEKMPLWNHFRGLGLVTLRNGWFNPDAAVLTFHCGDSYGFHSHFDQNSFSLWAGGPLLVDSGSRKGGDRHQNNYNVHTVAHNTLLVRMPGERFDWTDPGFNEGGQRRIRYPRTAGEFLHFRDAGYHSGHGDDRHYNTGDATAETLDGCYLVRGIAQDCRTRGGPLAYGPEKLEYFCRHLAWLDPGRHPGEEMLVLLDEVHLQPDQGSDPPRSYPCRWTFHSVARPEAIKPESSTEPDIFALVWEQPRKLVMRGMLCGAPLLERIGGPGKRFWVASTSTDYEDTSRSYPDAAGHWRVELQSANQLARQHLAATLCLGAGEQPTHQFVRSHDGGLVGVAVGRPWATAVLAALDHSDAVRRCELPAVTRIFVASLVPGGEYIVQLRPAGRRGPRRQLRLRASPGGWLQIPSASDEGLQLRLLPA